MPILPTALARAITATGGQDVLSLSTPITGTLNATGSLSAKATGAVGDALGAPARRQRRQADRRHQHQESQRQRRDQGQRRHHRAAEDRRPHGGSSPTSPLRSISATPASPWPERAPACRRRSPLIDKQVADQLVLVQARMQRSGLRAECADAMGPRPAARFRCRGPGRVSATPGAGLRIAPDPGDRGPACVDASAVTLTLGIEAETRVTSSRPSRSVHFATITIVPPTPEGSRSACRSTCPSPRSTRSSRRSSPERPFREDLLGLGRRHGETRQRHGSGRPPG